MLCLADDLPVCTQDEDLGGIGHGDNHCLMLTLDYRHV
jgi:hypothetical protein